MNTHPQDFDFATDMMYIRGIDVRAVDLDDTAKAIIERLREDGAIAKDTPLKAFPCRNLKRIGGHLLHTHGSENHAPHLRKDRRRR